MKKKQKFESLYDLQDYFRTEKQCIKYFIKQRWKITCPHENCKKFYNVDNKIYKLKSGTDFTRACCGRIFSYKTGTIFENSKISMRKWFMAIYLQTANKKGISSPQLARQIKVNQQTAWFMLKRLKKIVNK